MNFLLDALIKLIIHFRGTIFGFFKVISAIAGLIFTLGSILYGFVEINGGLDGIANSINGLNAYLVAMPVNPIMSYVNRAVPLNEFLVMEIFILLLQLLASITRMFKSLIPTYG